MIDSKIEFIAKTFNDIGKAIFIAGLIGNFFPTLPTEYRITLGVLSFILMAISIVIFPGGKK